VSDMEGPAHISNMSYAMNNTSIDKNIWSYHKEGKLRNGRPRNTLG